MTERHLDSRQGSLRSRIAAFLESHTTLTLATVGSDALPAAAAVFYAHDPELNLYFLSEPDTRHGQNLIANSHAAGTIQADGQDWRSIQGLQVQGEAFLLPAPQVLRAATLYGRKYTFVGSLLGGSGGPVSLAGPLARARFWILRPAWFRLVDNTVSFGFKEELVLGEKDQID